MKAIMTGVLMALAITTAGAEPDYFSANYILPGCKKIVESGRFTPLDENTNVMGFCSGVIYALRPRIWAGCVNPPNGLTIKPEAVIVVRYIEARPQRWHELFINLATEALLEAWPCRH